MKDKITPILVVLLALLIVIANRVEAQAPADSCFAAYVVSFDPGTTRDGGIVENNNSYSVVTGNAQGGASSFSLGLGGQIVVAFQTPVSLGGGDDLWVQERNSNTTGSPENVKVEVSADGINYFTVTQNLRQSEAFDIIAPTGVPQKIKYVRLTDVSDPATSRDGYDLDRVAALRKCDNCTSTTASTVTFDDPSGVRCLNSTAAVTLTGDGPWQVGYSNGTELAVANITNPNDAITLRLSTKTWLSWVTDNNDCTTIINNSDTLEVAEPAEVYIRETFYDKLENNQICHEGEQTVIPLIIRGRAPWTVTYTFTQGGVTTTSTEEVKEEDIVGKDTHNWVLDEAGTYVLQSVEDACGMGAVITNGVTNPALKIDSVVLIDEPTARFIDPDIVCNDSEKASLNVALTGVAPWQLVWEVEGVEYTESNITTSTFSLPLELSGQYTLKSVLGAIGCEGTILEDSIVTVFTPATAQLLQKSRSICDPAEEVKLTVNLGGSAPFTFAYLLDGEVVDTVATVSETYELTVEKLGTYQLAWVQNICGEGEASGEVAIQSEEQNFTSFTYSVLNQTCSSATLLLEADSASDDFQYRWYADQNLIGDTQEVQYHASSWRTTNFSLVVANGICSDSITQEVAIEALVTNGLGRFKYGEEGAPTCEGQAFTFRSDSVGSSLTYQWRLDDEIVGNEADFTTQLSSGLYNVQLIVNDGSCQYSSQQQLSVPEIDQSTLANFSYVRNESTSCNVNPITLQADTEGDERTYRWLVNGEEVGESATVNYDLASGESEITLEVTSGECTYTSNQTLSIEGISLPSAGAFDYGVEEVNCSEQSLSASALDLGEGVQYEWWLNEELISEQERISTTLTSGEYTLRLVTQLGECRYETEELVLIASIESLVNVPNVLSPQATQPDDQVAKVYGRCFAEAGFLFQVIDRWGGIAYETTNVEEALNQGWDGGNHPSGVYTYILRGQFNGGSSFQKQGKITLIK
ncbi:hypothetical protein [Tunicatimonas pelagia]|uniref:hypothetical protein n=1 Tax=Tunicatimonas pelagia TaxID=931531 RepID=UPI002666A7A3|nr:hypothetical protein [Tunicatimonas pelagia]WKN43935.1 hypothetical protein P0M28_02985 [Tunicatimonas pelagia]